MKSTLAKSVFVGLAALSVASVAQVNANAASKKSHAKTVSNVALTTDATTRNVVVTGKNAIFSYPKTVKKNARTVASKATVAQLANSKKSSDYFRAYRVLKTSKGSIYYKVVSFDGKYRGYVYGGKNANKFDAGLASAQTTSAVELSAQQKAQSYYFKTPGKSNVTWDAPHFTQYGAKKLITDTSSYKNDALVVTSAVQKTREGSQFYYVTDAQHPNLNGYVFAGALTNQAPEAENLVKINFKTADGQVIKTSSYAPAATVAKGAEVKSDVNTFVNDHEKDALKGTGYHYTASDTYNESVLTDSQASVKAGSTINLIVVKNDSVHQVVDFTRSGTATVKPEKLTQDDFQGGYPEVLKTAQSSLTGTNDTAFNMNSFENDLTAAGKPLNTIVGKTTTSKDGKTTSTVVYTYDKATTDEVNAKAMFGQDAPIHLYYTAKTTTKDVPAVTPAQKPDTNTDYVAK